MERATWQGSGRNCAAAGGSTKLGVYSAGVACLVALVRGYAKGAAIL